jgi:hypothetical protein
VVKVAAPFYKVLAGARPDVRDICPKVTIVTALEAPSIDKASTNGKMSGQILLADASRRAF